MSIEEDEDASLKELVTKTLQTNGVLGKIQAQLRASVFLTLEEEFNDKGIPMVSPPTRQVLGTHEGAVAACLVQDFLQCLGLDFSLAVFSPESGHPSLWSFPGSEALSSSLGLASRRGKRGINDDKGHSIPLLIELLREREVLPLAIQEQNGEASSISSSNSSNCNREQHSVQQNKQLQDGAGNSSDHLQKAHENHLWTKQDTGERQEAEELQASPILHPLILENGRKRKENILGSQKTTGLLDLPPPHESKPESDTSINGKDKQYEDDFSSMSEKYDHDEDDDEEEVEEDIEEDLGDISADDLLNSSASGVSDLTQDQSFSEVSGVPAYQENI